MKSVFVRMPVLHSKIHLIVQVIFRQFLTNPQAQAGTVVINNFPSPESNVNTDFVAKTTRIGRHKKQVEEIYFNLVSYSGVVPFVTDSTGLIICKRQ